MEKLTANQRYKASGSIIPFKEWIEQEDAKTFSADGAVTPSNLSGKKTEILIGGVSSSTLLTVVVSVVLLTTALHFYNKNS